MPSPPRQFGRYRIDKELGSGGMGTVWLAHDTTDDRPVALKVPSYRVDEEPAFLERFHREAMAVGKLHHPNICPVLDVGEIDGIHYFTMPVIEGASLSQMIRRGSLPAAEQAVLWVRKVALALHEAHQHGIIHRDVKPSNIMLTPAGEPIIMDFGVARVLEASPLTRPGDLLGTPGYMAPEVARGETLGPGCDVYSLGVVLYQLLTGKLPLEGRTVAEVLYQMLEKDPEPPSRHRRGLNKALDAICLRALAKSVEARYPSMADFAAALGRYLAPSPDTRPPGGAGPDEDTPLPAKKSITNSIGMCLVLIPAGKFSMGSPPQEAERGADEGPLHLVEIPRPFFMGVFPVTQEEYRAVMGSNPASFSAGGGGSPAHPVENVSWSDAVAFCRRLSALPEEKQQGRVYRLPTEAEWEYACRAGTRSAFAFGDALSSTQANFEGDYPYGGVARGPDLQQTVKVGSYKPNLFGLYDMHGNVAQWCQDYYDEHYYQVSPKVAPRGPSRGPLRVLRGGSWIARGRSCRSASRDKAAPGFRANIVGFRVVCEAAAGDS
jgi:formylglycine-generating enzyme required for sulfatase activity